MGYSYYLYYFILLLEVCLSDTQRTVHFKLCFGFNIQVTMKQIGHYRICKHQLTSLLGMNLLSLSNRFFPFKQDQSAQSLLIYTECNSSGEVRFGIDRKMTSADNEF